MVIKILEVYMMAPLLSSGTGTVVITSSGRSCLTEYN
ncbi:unnamed protein product [Lathyrus sativus]|nr:unnamed protein product [Lathyrus sativus]